MKIIRTIREMQEYSLQLRAEGKQIGFVPTMGFLHKGHLSLIDIARECSDIVVMSIFVNPTQFGPNEDFDSYPRNFERDCQLAESRKVDVIFAPEPREMYPTPMLLSMHVGQLSENLCGKNRPGHFDGVATVVAKLFLIVQPHIAVFGQKDYQQLVILKLMVQNFNFPIEILSAPTAREESGLARSSRNKYLNDEQKIAAPKIYQGLQKALKSFQKGQRISEALKKAVSSELESTGQFTIDYIELVDGATLAEKAKASAGDIIAVAAKIGSTRLIDNIMLIKESI